MKVVTLKDLPDVPVDGAAEPIEGWTGPVRRSRQTIIEPGESANYNCSVVNFSQGCTTGWHTHTCDQLLIVTSGSGMARDQRRRCRADQGRRTPLARRQGRYDHGAYHDHGRWRSSHLGIIPHSSAVLEHIELLSPLKAGTQGKRPGRSDMVGIHR